VRTPLVSILIPAYNADRWLAATIDSALRQTWPRKEIIIVDDGSTDQTFSVAQMFKAAGVSVYRQENQGAAAARNTALALSQGDFIQWLDADDILSEDKIFHQISAALEVESLRTLSSCSWAHFRFRIRKARFSVSPLWQDLEPTEWLLRKWEANLHMQTATWLVSRELTELAGPWDTRLLGDDDGEYFSRVVTLSDRIRFIRESKVYYRVMPSGRLSYIGKSHAKMDAQFLGMQLQINRLRARVDSPRARAACITYLQTWLRSFYPERPDMIARAQAIAEELGGFLCAPTMRWKYAWIEKLFGFGVAKEIQRRYNRIKASLLRTWDWSMFLLEERLGWREYCSNGERNIRGGG
jgi:glycosyltransferase involved in cell wall biosynthesis